MKNYSTEAVARGSRVSYWNDLHWSAFAPLEFRPADRDSFEASVSIQAFGPVWFAKTFAEASSIDHTEEHVRLTPQRRVFLMMPVHGRVVAHHYGREAELAEGDFVLSDSAAPGRNVLLGRNRAYCIGMSYAAFARYIPNPEPLFGLKMPGGEGLGRTVQTLWHCLWGQIEQGLPEQFGPPLAKNLLDLVATAYAMHYSSEIAESTLASGRRAQIKRFIETHLKDTDLSASAVAASLRLSSRYVRMVFAGSGEGVADYILRRRLEEAAQALASAPLASRSITDVAFEWGFSSTAHFARAFKEQFGATPSEYRRRHGADAPHSI